ncbi:hypothetical protein FSP39_011856 [Pinctada imbricata]|uniref:Uncharacterized protein n=1 Tax=Pinctada imbricata TaxID=66713 RepID=A0AA88YMC9_PINIB|nr:hypothetical protein FSP39_011856 [Pinctada imbricata]
MRVYIVDMNSDDIISLFDLKLRELTEEFTLDSSIHSSQEDLLLGDSPPPVTSSTSWLGSHTSVNSAISHISTGMTPTPSSDSIVALTSTPVKDTAPKVILRRKQETSPEDDAVKLHRRTSYLMATANDRDTHKLSLDKSISSSQSGLEIQEQITPPKSSMTKLKNLFGEKTPAIKEAIERTSHRQDPASPLQEITKQGTLTFKSDLTDGKKASDRSWKSVWVELRGHALYLSKEKKDQSLSHPFSFEDQPISIKSSFVDKAYDYTKKKHVFRLKTFNMSEYLFQAEDEDIMMSWIRAIQSNNNPDADDIGIGQEGLIKRKTSQQENMASQITITALKQSPQVLPKPNKLAVLKSKMPHSPSTKRKKSEKEDGSKKSSLFKFKSFRKTTINSSSGNSDDNCMFGVPLECCIPSPNNDHVPMIVDLCTKIVEARGLEVTGVYRIPGNTAAVNMMQEELNKGIDNMNVEHEKWCDVNVIGSLLKTFFRKLPDPLITAELYQQFINANRIENPQTRMLKLKRLLHEMPEHHFETFKHLADHLHTVSIYGHLNKMDARNLAIVFGPTLIRKDDDMSALVRDMSDSCRIIESVISHHDWFFSSWDRDNEVPIEEGRDDDDAPTNPSISKMSCDDDDAINPRDIVSSIVQAANLKLRKKSGTDKSFEDLDVSLSEGGFRERNIDLEVKRRGMKPHVEITSRSSPNLMAMSGVVGSQEQLTLVPNRNSDTCSI